MILIVLFAVIGTVLGAVLTKGKGAVKVMGALSTTGFCLGAFVGLGLWVVAELLTHNFAPTREICKETELIPVVAGTEQYVETVVNHGTTYYRYCVKTDDRLEYKQVHFARARILVNANSHKAVKHEIEYTSPLIRLLVFRPDDVNKNYTELIIPNTEGYTQTITAQP